jgi:hypothetical protein
VATAGAANNNNNNDISSSNDEDIFWNDEWAAALQHVRK